ncbi:MAG: NlpC/P60 family protein [Candidatus Bruticola sp.]
MADNEAESLYVVSVPVVSVFADIYDDSERLTQVLLGEPVYVKSVSESGDWKQVVVPNQYREPEGYPGWINGSFLTEQVGFAGQSLNLGYCAQPCLREWSIDSRSADSVMIISPQSFVYVKPDQSAARLGRVFATTLLSLGSQVCQTGAGGQKFWVVSWPGSNQSGYIPYENGSRQVLPTKAEEVLLTAFRFKGTAYLWGGLSCHGIDCSGLVYVCCRLHGLIVPRDADQQFLVGMPLSKDELEPGDLVFFGADEEHVSHVGFYVGDGSFLDASGKKGVSLSNLNKVSNVSKYHFLGGRRYFAE